ncbi:hypothetical protein L0244_04190 [bacterium]|nr:hypothetical protein [bacterium]
MGTLVYTAVTFPIAVVWHVTLFKDLYQSFGYFAREPNFVLGLLSIVIQGVLLSWLFPLVRLSGTSVKRGLKFIAIVGPFFWTSHVLAFVAKQAFVDATLFVAMETGYLTAQFGVFGLLLGLIYRGSRDEA